jgi:AcrR family transcriptional regulator
MVAQDLTSPVVGKRRERVRAQMRQEILDAARRILREQGIKELSMRGLGQAVGVTAPTLYDYFASKEGVLDALFQEGAERLLRAFENAVAAHEPGVAQLRAIAVAYRAFAHEEPDLFQLIFGRVDRTYRPAEEVKSRAAALFEILVQAMVEATAAGQLRPVDPMAAAVSAWAIVHGFVVLEINGYLDDCTPQEGNAAFEASLQIMFEGLGQ